MKKTLPVLMCMLLLFSIATANQNVLANTPQSASEPTFEGEKIDFGDRYTIVVTTAEGTLTAIQDKATQEFLSVEADYLSEKEEASQLEALKSVKVIEMTDSIPPVNGAIVDSSALVTNKDFSTNSIYNKWYNGHWKNYTITFEKKATVSIITVAILSRIPYVGWVVGPIAAILVLYQMKVGYFSARYDYMFLGGVNMKERQHLKVWENSDYTNLLKYTTKTKKTRGK